MRGFAVFLAFIITAPVIVAAEQEWPGEPIDNHVHMTWAAMTIEVNNWADDNPDIVDLVDVGNSEAENALVVRLSDWSMETKADGSRKKSSTSTEDIIVTNTLEQL